MRLVADLHVHSRHSIATSPKLRPAYLERWARIKGIGLLGTGDCSHPAWLAELREALEPVEEGLYKLRDGIRRDFDAGEALSEELPDPAGGRGAGEEPDMPRFVLSGEISTIYSRGGRTRKVHHLVILPSLEAAAALQARLERLGNISSDGRPILGLDSRDLLAELLEADDRSILVPAHIWTPWFSALGARSGFDSIEECYRDLAPRIGAIETGLSSNPPMNWALSALDRFAIISSSDAHSPEKLAREATAFEMERSFAGLAAALSGGGPRGRILETIEFFPQEGKYHYDGHRACGIALSPEESLRAGGLCPACGKPLTPGVLGRVAELADRPVDEAAPCPASGARANQRPYASLIPLKELVAELLEIGEGSRKAAVAYRGLVEAAGSELALLADMGEAGIEALGAIGGISGELLSAAIGRMRAGQVSIEPGYDGEYGLVRAFAPGEAFPGRPAVGLFGEAPERPRAAAGSRRGRAGGRAGAMKDGAPSGPPRDRSPAGPQGPGAGPSPFALDPAQEAAVGHGAGAALVIAGPGSGKTAVLALRVARLVEGGLPPASILALTFTNKAAGELRERIARSVSPEAAAALTASTFHSYCRALLRERGAEAGLPADFSILDEDERYAILLSVGGRPGEARRLGGYVEARKRFLLLPGEERPRLGPGAPEGLAELASELGPPALDPSLDAGYAAYRAALREAGALDFDDLVAGAARLLAARPGLLAACRESCSALFVDEYQDLNFAQYALMRLLAPSGGEAGPFAIGDPNQAIYGFRGSDRRFIGRFLEDYPGAARYELRKSFRCAPPIVAAAGALVGAGLEGGLSPGSSQAILLSRAEYPTGNSEAEGIAREIDALIGGTRFFAYDSGIAGPARSGLRSLGECAILVRAAALAPPIVKALGDHGLPCELVGERPWWAEEPAASVLALLRSASRPGRAAGGSGPALAPRVPGLDSSRVEELRARLPGLSPEGALREAAALAGAGPDAAEAVERLAERASASAELGSFLDELAMGSPAEGRGPRTEKVSVMTIHAAKGLEFDLVFVAGLEEGILPFTLYDEGGSEDRERVEEERRLLYVAMTRARTGLRLSWARSRSFRGRELALGPSRFLSEIGLLLPELDRGPARPREPQLGLF